MAKRKPPDPFVEACLARLAPLGPVRARAMFGGHGVYCEDRMFALVVGDRIYFKADDQCRAAFQADGAEPFTYMGKDRPHVMSYWGRADADDALFLRFAERGLAAARRKAR